MSYIHSITIYAVPIERTWKGDSNDTKNSKSQKKSTFGVLEKSQCKLKDLIIPCPQSLTILLELILTHTIIYTVWLSSLAFIYKNVYGKHKAPVNQFTQKGWYVIYNGISSDNNYVLFLFVVRVLLPFFTVIIYRTWYEPSCVAMLEVATWLASDTYPILSYTPVR